MPFQSVERITLTPAMVIKFLCKPTKRGAVCSAEQAVRFMMLCKARALNPWEGDAFIVGYDAQDGPEFNLITAHQAFLKRAEAHGNFEGMESGVILANADGVLTEVQGDFIPYGLQLAGGWAKVYRSDRKIPCYRRLNLKTFEKPYGVWKTNPQGMIVKTAEADALRSSFPNSMSGMFLEGEHPEPVRVESSSVPGRSRAEALNRQLQEQATPTPSRPVSEGQTLVPADEPIPATDDVDAPADQASKLRQAVKEQESQNEDPAKEEKTAPDAAAPTQDAPKSTPSSGKVQINEPAVGSLKEFQRFLSVMLEAGQDLGKHEDDVQTFLKLAIGDTLTNVSKQNKQTEDARRTLLHRFVKANGGEMAKS